LAGVGGFWFLTLFRDQAVTGGNRRSVCVPCVGRGSA
jgi:hypothetical protein